MSQVVDPAVSRLKFAREVERLRAVGSTLSSRGMWLMTAEFPIVKVAFATVGVRPRMIPFAVKVDFTDYDVLPLALSFVDAFEDRELLPSEMMTKLPRAVTPKEAGLSDAELPPGATALVELYQHYAQTPQLPGFLCLQGTRAYHAHPAHSGDPWELHRSAGEGRLFGLLETVWRYGAAPLDRMQVAVSPVQSAYPS